MGSPNLFLAATTTLDKLQKIPPAFWLKLLGAVAAVILVVVIFRKVLKINKFVLGGIVFIGGGLIFFNWIYNRTEPAFLTPLVNRIAPFFPAAGSYNATQAKTPDQPKK
jgi:drug/metabolite transporter (DMT)-like permease